MATVVERMGAYAAGLRYDDLGTGVVDYAKRILLDSLACSYGGLDSEPARIVRSSVKRLNDAGQATIWADGSRATAPLAALANGVAIRYQDYNDVYFGPAWTAHPSDNIATLIATAEWLGATGRELLTAIVATYEVQMRFSDLPVPRNLWHRGWHHTTACSYAAAAGVAKLMKLDGAQTGHALALAGARSNTLAEIRHGNIPMDKALSAPLVASQAILYALLASQGFTGSETILEGRYGFKAAVAGGVDVEPLVPKAGDFRILKVGLKPYPVEGMTPAMVQAALELREEHGIKPHEVQAIAIHAHEEAVTKPSWDEKKLAPTTKETADHSFYYCVAVALVAGKVTSAQFTDEWLKHPDIARLIGLTTMEAKPHLTALFKKGARPAAVEIRTGRGTFLKEVPYPKGDPNNPMTWDDVGRKFAEESAACLDDATRAEITAWVRGMEGEADIGAFSRLLARRPGG
jgi:2-methylcitrate dehydratase